MGAPRYSKKRDENEPQIIAEFEALGCKVERMEPPMLDLLVGLPNKRLIVVDVKDPAKDKRYGSRKHGNLTPSQRDLMAKWTGWPFFVVETTIEARGIVFALGGKEE